MAQPVTLKVYANIYPANREMYDTFAEICNAAISAGAGNEPDKIVTLDGDLLRISFEGVYFPVQELLKAIEQGLQKDQQGKMDVLDLDAWTLERHVFDNGNIASAKASLNNVLDYSGH